MRSHDRKTRKDRLMTHTAPPPAYPPGWARTTAEVLDVAILGAGQTGVAIWHGLRQVGVDNTAIFDAAAAGAEGVWRDIARMRTLRTDKEITGPELGDAALTFRAWFTARHGANGYDAIDRISRGDWQRYLDWFRERVGARPHYGHRLTAIAPEGDALVLTFATAQGPRQIRARHLALATGVDGFGAPHIPEDLRAIVPGDRLIHTADPLPAPADLSGKRILVVGGAAAAFDAAAVLLEQGAAAVHQISRQSDIPADLPRGALLHIATNRRFFHRLSDLARWQNVLQIRKRGVPPQTAVDRARALPGHHLHLGRDLTGLRQQGGGVALVLDGREEGFDLVVVGTGYRQGAHLRPEFAALAPLIRHWADLGLPAPPEARHWGDLPYLGDGFQLLPRDPGDDWVSRIHVMTFAAILSHGLHVGDIGSTRISVERLRDHLALRIFQAAAAVHNDEILAAAGGGAAPAAQKDRAA